MRYKKLFPLSLLLCLLPFLPGCGVYSLTGASITGKTINIHNLENRAPSVAPSLSATLTAKLRDRILSQTGLAAVNSDNADYDMMGTITSYAVSGNGAQATGTAGQVQSASNRLSITVEVDFKNRKEEKSSFKQSFTRFADFPAGQPLTAVESGLIDQISELLATDIFNKAFVNW